MSSGRVSRRLTAAAAVLGLIILTSLVAVGSPAAAAPRTGAITGSWQVTPAGGGRYEVTWRSPSRLPVGSDRPRIVARTTAQISTSTVDADGRTVRAVLLASNAPRTADFQVLLSGDRLDVPGRDRPRTSAISSGATATPPRTTVADPAKTGPYPVVSSDYTRTAVKLPGMAAPIEMVGHVVEPAPGTATGPRPLVLFQHGRHEACYQARKGEPNDTWPCRGTMAEVPSQLGYDYAQRLLASQGYTTVSIRVNGINAQDYQLGDGGADARAAIIRRHLDYWTTIAAAHQVDLGKVVLVGHSRGGEGVDRASIQIPLGAPYRVVGQVLIAPTDFAEQAAPYVPTVTVLPYCDGDVSDLQGQHFADIARDVSAGDTALHSSVLIMGANHNFFNSEWTPGSVAPSQDDWGGEPKAPCGSKAPGRLSAAQQRATGKVYVAAAVRLFAAGQQQFLPLLDGTAATTGSLGPAVTYSHAVGGGRDVRRPGRDLSLGLAQGARTDLCRGATAEDFRANVCGAPIGGLTAPHWYAPETAAPTRSFWRMRWTAAGQTGAMLLNRPLDLADRRLDLRTIVDPRQGTVRLRIRLTDATGTGTTLTPVNGEALAPLPTLTEGTKLWAQTLRVDPAGSGTESRIDLHRVVRIDLIGTSAKGTVYVADVAAHGDTLAPVPSVRVPLLSVGSTRVVEGNGNGFAVADVGWRLSAPAPTAAGFTVNTVDRTGSARRYQIDVAPGQQSGTIEVGYPTNRIDDESPAVTEVSVWAGTNLMTDRYLGGLSVIDDDPTPTATVRPVHATITEGSTAGWLVRLAAPVGYTAYVEGRIVAPTGKAPQLRGTDVPASWFADHCNGRRSDTLAKAGCEVYAAIRPGDRSATLTVPTLRTEPKERTETVTLRSTVLGRTTTSTVQVKNRP